MLVDSALTWRPGARHHAREGGQHMRRILALVGVAAALGALVAGAVVAWRRNPRIGSGTMNAVVNPVLLRRGLAGGGRSEIGTLEHVGRTSGIRRLTPVHPEPTPEGFRIVVPLGAHSQWARNVLAAGQCRIQLHDIVYDLDEPAMIPASDATDLPAAVRAAMSKLGFEYLTLRTFASAPGSLEPVELEAFASDPPAAVREAGEAPARESVSPAT
jgi:deazaflavin-dependent oxidoreductase (nitroreductase family)